MKRQMMRAAAVPGFDRLLRMRSTWLTQPRKNWWLPAGGCWICTSIGMLLGGLALAAGFVLGRVLVQ